MTFTVSGMRLVPTCAASCETRTSSPIVGIMSFLAKLVEPSSYSSIAKYAIASPAAAAMADFSRNGGDSKK